MMEDATLPLTHLITAARFRYVMLRILWWLLLGTQATGSSMECLWAKTCSENQGFRVLGGQTYPNGQRFFFEHGRSWGMGDPSGCRMNPMGSNRSI